MISIIVPYWYILNRVACKYGAARRGATAAVGPGSARRGAWCARTVRAAAGGPGGTHDGSKSI